MSKKEANEVLSKLLMGSKCPKCGSLEIGFNFIVKEWNCNDCGHEWKDEGKKDGTK